MLPISSNQLLEKATKYEQTKIRNRTLASRTSRLAPSLLWTKKAITMSERILRKTGVGVGDCVLLYLTNYLTTFYWKKKNSKKNW